MSSTLPKRKDLTITPKLTELGFTEIYCLGKMLILCTGNEENIQCKLDNSDLTKTTEKYLKSSLDRHTKFKPEEKEIICTHVCKMLLDSINQQIDEEKEEKQQEQKEIQNILDEINQMREQNTNITFQTWQEELQIKYQKLYDKIQNIMPEIWPGLEFELSVLRILSIENCTLPFIGIILGRPSSYKTVIVSLMRKWPHAFYTDNFTARSFVSHSTAVNSREDLEEIDMLPKIKNKLFLTPELSPMFTTKEEDLVQLLGIITRIADGHGFMSDSGAHGHRGYDEDIMFSWVGAAVDIPYKVYKILGNLGAKLYFFRMQYDQQTSEQLTDYAADDEGFISKVLEIQNLLFGYLKWFEICPDMKPKMKWDKSNDNKDALKYIVGMGDLLSYLRCPAKVWETRDSQGSDYAYSISLRESPRRAITCLKNLARGHALLTGRNYITLDDVSIVIKTAFDTAAIERVSIFNLLIANNGRLTTEQIVQSLNVAGKTALRTMAEFKNIGLVSEEDFHQPGQNNLSKRITLDPRFNWFLTDPMITKIVPHTTPKSISENGSGDGHKLDIEKLWPLFDELEREEQEDPANFVQADKNTVNRKNLHDKLVESGYFSTIDAEETIDEMVRMGKLEQVMMDTLRRR
jgi:hypothetical protein